MTRVATYQNSQSALLNLQRAQAREHAAGQQVSTGLKGNDLKAYGRDAENVTALKSVQTRVNGWLETAELTAGRLQMQDVYLNRGLEAATDARTAIEEALASDRGEGLAQAIRNAFGKAVTALNAKHEGKVLFGGARLEETPFEAQVMSDLTAPGVTAAADLFNDDALKATVRVGEGAPLQIGERASEFGGQLMEDFRRFQQFLEGPDGNFGHPLTTAQKSFLQGEIAAYKTDQTTFINAVSRNGAAQTALDDAIVDLTGRAGALKGLIADRTEVDVAQAISELETARTAVQATAQVFSTLKGSSLLELLR